MSTGLQGTFSDYYVGLSDEEWFKNVSVAQLDALNAVRITTSGFGLCENCGRSEALYDTQTSTKQREKICAPCTRKAMRFEILIEDAFNTIYAYLGTQTSAINSLWPEDYLPKHEDTRPICPCSRMVLKAEDYRVSMTYLHNAVEVMYRGEQVMAHKTCTYTCDGCNELKYGNQYAYFDGSPTCEPCTDERVEYGNYDRCSYCDEYFSELHYSEDRDRELCDHCFHESWSCSECYGDRTEGDEHECYRTGLIYDYSYKPAPDFYGTDKYYFGFELEVEDINEHGTDAGAQVVLDELGERVYCKHDGSLNDGFEIVSHPHTFDQLENLNWDWLTSLRRLGFRSWDTNTCGLHVHISRTAFWKDGKRNEAHELRFQKLIYDNSRMVEAIAGRSSAYARFKDKGYLVPKIKHGQQADRYEAVNSFNDATLEVRVFRGSLKKQRILSAIEFLHAATEYTRDMRINPKDKQLSWFRFMAYVLDNQDKYANFTQVAMKALENTSVGQSSTDEDN